jgi:TorA maturation chaperone TorD
LHTSSSVRSVVGESDQLRARLYRFLARILCLEPDQNLLDKMKHLEGDETELGAAFGALGEIASSVDLEAARTEYFRLFIGVGRGELIPYGSYYLTGFLNEKPLARLREDMSRLSIERTDETKEPEDHAGALMDMMAGLIEGDFGAIQPLAIQKDFFAKHVVTWTPHFFYDLERAKTARLYSPIGRIGRLFMEIEEAAFEM